MRKGSPTQSDRKPCHDMEWFHSILQKRKLGRGQGVHHEEAWIGIQVLASCKIKQALFSLLTCT